MKPERLKIAEYASLVGRLATDFPKIKLQERKIRQNKIPPGDGWRDWG